MRKPVYLALLAALVFAVVGTAAPDKKSTGPRMLVLSMQRVIDETTEGKEFVKRLNEEMAAKKKKLGEESAKLQAKVKELSEAQLTDRTPEFYEDYQKAMKTHARMEGSKNMFLLRKGDEISRATNELIRGAQEEAKKIMRVRGADMVILSRMGPLKINNDKEFQQELVFRRVICAKGDVDITDQVIKAMNEWYKLNKGGKEKPKRAESAAAAGKVTPAKKVNEK